MTKEQRRLLMPESTEFIDQMREIFGEIEGIEANENGLTVEWGNTFKDCDSFPLVGK